MEYILIKYFPSPEISYINTAEKRDQMLQM